MEQSLDKLHDKREAFRVKLRRESKNNMLRKKRTKIIEFAENQEVLLETSGGDTLVVCLSQERQLELYQLLKECTTTETLLVLLQQLETNRIGRQEMLELLLKIANSILGGSSRKPAQQQADKKARELILSIVFRFTALPDKQLHTALPTLAEFLKHREFFELYLNISLIMDWGPHEHTLRPILIELLMGITDQRESLKKSSVIVIENFLLTGDVSDPMLFRFSNAINRSLGVDQFHSIYHQEEVQVSITRSLKLIARQGDHHRSNIINCRHVGPWLDWLLVSSSRLKVLTQVCELLGQLVNSKDERLALKLYRYNPTLLIQLTYQLNKTHVTLREKVSETLVGVASSTEGCMAIVQYRLAQKVLEYFHPSNSTVFQKNLAFFTIRLLSGITVQLRLDLLQASTTKEIIRCILYDCVQPTFVDARLAWQTFQLLTKICEDSHSLVTEILQEGSIHASIEKLAVECMVEEISRAAAGFLSIYRNNSKIEEVEL